MKQGKSWMMLIMKIGLITTVLATFTEREPNGTYKDDLEKLITAVSDVNGQTIEWSLYAREMIHISSPLQLETKLKKLFPEWKWTSDTKESTYSLVGHVNNGNFSETIKLVRSNESEQVASYVYYEVGGTEWNKTASNELEKLFHLRARQLFDQQPVTFSCIKGEFNTEYEQFIQQPFDKLLHLFQADEKESLKEKDFRSITAYSSLFLQNSSFDYNEMNLQMALRKNKSGGTSFVIGTPILTIEY